MIEEVGGKYVSCSSTCICSAFSKFLTIMSIFLLLFVSRMYFSKKGKRPCRPVDRGSMANTSDALICEP